MFLSNWQWLLFWCQHAGFRSGHQGFACGYSNRWWHHNFCCFPSLGLNPNCFSTSILFVAPFLTGSAVGKQTTSATWLPPLLKFNLLPDATTTAFLTSAAFYYIWVKFECTTPESLVFFKFTWAPQMHRESCVRVLQWFPVGNARICTHLMCENGNRPDWGHVGLCSSWSATHSNTKRLSREWTRHNRHSVFKWERFPLRPH